MPTAIEFNNVSKQYRLGLVSTKTLSHDLNRWWQTSVLHKEDPYLKIGSTNDRSKAADSEYVWALKDIDFKIEQGDVVGIIGKNGAGKSTLLKLLSRVTGPTTGTIRARGRIGSLLEVGTGFHPEMTGRENIYMNGASLGMTKPEIAKKLDEIIDFSGCERYIDTPVKRYSSGMTVRLGFAVAAHLDPEILVVDEVLAVGDAEFQKKAIGKMQDVSKGEGRTVLFVSHNMGSVRNLCHTGILLEKGMVKYSGDIASTIAKYQLSTQLNGGEEMVHKQGGYKASLKKCVVYSAGNKIVSDVMSGEKIRIVLTIENKTEREIAYIDELTIGIDNMYGDPCLLLNNICLGKTVVLAPGDNMVEFVIDRFPLATGIYKIGFYLSDRFGVLDNVEKAFILNVDSSSFYESGKYHFNSKFLVDYDMKIVGDEENG